MSVISARRESHDPATDLSKSHVRDTPPRVWPPLRAQRGTDSAPTPVGSAEALAPLARAAALAPDDASAAAALLDCARCALPPRLGRARDRSFVDLLLSGGILMDPDAPRRHLYPVCVCAGASCGSAESSPRSRRSSARGSWMARTRACRASSARRTRACPAARPTPSPRATTPSSSRPATPRREGRTQIVAVAVASRAVVVSSGNTDAIARMNPISQGHTLRFAEFWPILCHSECGDASLS